MRKKFRVLSPLLLLLAGLSFAACGGSGDEEDPLDRELDLAMAQDSLAALADTAMATDGEGEAQAEAPAEAPPRRDPPPAARPRQTTPTPDPKPRTPAYRDFSVSAGSLLQVSLDQELSTESSNVGDKFTVTLLAPVTDATGLVIPAGTKIQGEVTALEVSGSSGEQAMIRLDFGQLLLDGESYQVALTVSEANATTRGRKSTEEKAVTIGAGAVVGGILGRVIGGNATGTIIGGVAGAAAGTAIAHGHRGRGRGARGGIGNDAAGGGDVHRAPAGLIRVAPIRGICHGRSSRAAARLQRSVAERQSAAPPVRRPQQRAVIGHLDRLHVAADSVSLLQHVAPPLQFRDHRLPASLKARSAPGPADAGDGTGARPPSSGPGSRSRCGWRRSGTIVVMIVAPPGVPVTRSVRPSGSTTMVGVIADSMRLPGAMALASPCTSPNWFGTPGFEVKSSISLFSRKPAPRTTTFDPNQLLIVVVTATAFPSRSTIE